jgi:hypothetical protein
MPVLGLQPNDKAEPEMVPHYFDPRIPDEAPKYFAPGNASTGELSPKQLKALETARIEEQFGDNPNWLYLGLQGVDFGQLLANIKGAKPSGPAALASIGLGAIMSGKWHTPSAQRARNLTIKRGRHTLSSLLEGKPGEAYDRYFRPEGLLNYGSDMADMYEGFMRPAVEALANAIPYGEEAVDTFNRRFSLDPSDRQQPGESDAAYEVRTGRFTEAQHSAAVENLMDLPLPGRSRMMSTMVPKSAIDEVKERQESERLEREMMDSARLENARRMTNTESYAGPQYGP